MTVNGIGRDTSCCIMHSINTIRQDLDRYIHVFAYLAHAKD